MPQQINQYYQNLGIALPQEEINRNEPDILEKCLCII